MTGPRSATIAVATLLALSACGSEHVNAPSAVPVQPAIEVPYAVATGCVPANMAPPPEYPDTDAALRAAAGPDERYQLIYAGRKLRIARSNEVEPVIAKCPKAAPK